MAKSSGGIIGRKTEAKAPNRQESHITRGGIETDVHAFFGGITNPVPNAEFTYGEHKKPGSESAPIIKSGRGKDGATFRKNLLTGGD